MDNKPFEELVLEKLNVIERRMTGIEDQLTIVARAYSQHGQRLTELEDNFMEVSVGTPTSAPAPSALVSE